MPEQDAPESWDQEDDGIGSGRGVAGGAASSMTRGATTFSEQTMRSLEVRFALWRPPTVAGSTRAERHASCSCLFLVQNSPRTAAKRDALRTVRVSQNVNEETLNHELVEQPRRLVPVNYTNFRI